MSLVITDAGRATVAKKLQATNACLIVGTGDVAWGATPPAVPADAVGLLAPVAVVRPLVKSFVLPDAAGVIETDDGLKWTLSETPTPFLYLSYVLGFQDGPNETLREAAISLDPVFAAGVPPGLTYVPWASVTAPGDLLGIERWSPTERAGVRLTVDRVISI